MLCLFSDSDEQRINEFEHEYWWETGRDSDGTWTEKEESEDRETAE